MKAYMKCSKCGRTIFTDHVDHLFTLLLNDEDYECKGCGGVIDFASVYICYKELGTGCDGCEFRFTCYSVRDNVGVVQSSAT